MVEKKKTKAPAYACPRGLTGPKYPIKTMEQAVLSLESISKMGKKDRLPKGCKKKATLVRVCGRIRKLSKKNPESNISGREARAKCQKYWGKGSKKHKVIPAYEGPMMGINI